MSRKKYEYFPISFCAQVYDYNPMIKHEDIWKAIDRLAEEHGYSPSGLARKAGLDPTSFNKSKRFSPEDKPRWPSTESIAKILAVTGTTMCDFAALVEADAKKKKSRK